MFIKGPLERILKIQKEIVDKATELEKAAKEADDLIKSDETEIKKLENKISEVKVDITKKSDAARFARNLAKNMMNLGEG